MNYGLAAIAVSVICLVAAMGFGAPVWVNIVGLAAGIAGVVLLGRGRKGGGS